MRPATLARLLALALACLACACGSDDKDDRTDASFVPDSPNTVPGMPIGTGPGDATTPTPAGDDDAGALDDAGNAGAPDAGPAADACERLEAVNGDCRRYRATIAAAVIHSCAIGTDEKAYCWGANTSGQLGDGSMVERQAPSAVNTIDKVKVIASRDNHVCAVLADGAAYCWGGNASGQLGDGTTADRAEPKHVLGGDDFTQIATGALHTCGVRTDGRVSCWGANPEGRLGDGTLDERHAATGFVKDLDTAAQVSAGLAHSCAVRRMGGVVCWGSNASGQLGDGTMADRSEPVDVVGIDDAVQVAVGATHSCAVRASGKVSCWGANDMGQLGDGSMAQHTSPVDLATPTDAVLVSIGVNHSCAVRKGGKVVCWGLNDNGEIGDTTVMPAPEPVQVQLDAGGALEASDVSAGLDHTCSAGDDGISCWGVGLNGRRGDGTVLEVHGAVGIGPIP